MVLLIAFMSLFLDTVVMDEPEQAGTAQDAAESYAHSRREGYGY